MIEARPSDYYLDQDRELTESLKKGGIAAFEEVFKYYSQPVFGFALSRLKNVQLAEDVTMDVFASAIANFEINNQKQKHTSVRGLLFRSARNAIIDEYRRARARTIKKVVPTSTGTEIELYERTWFAFNDSAPIDDCSEIEPISDAEIDMHFWVTTAMEQLTEEQRTVIRLKYFEGLTNWETAMQMGKTVGAVKSVHYRALASIYRIGTGEDLARKKL